MSTIRIDVVSAEESIYSGDAEFVVLPGIMGELGIYPRHAPLITQIRSGTVRIKVPGKEEEEMVWVQGGILEVQPHHINVLSDTAIRAADLDEAKVLEAKKQAEEAIRARTEKQDIATGRGRARDDQRPAAGDPEAAQEARLTGQFPRRRARIRRGPRDAGLLIVQGAECGSPETQGFFSWRPASGYLRFRLADELTAENSPQAAARDICLVLLRETTLELLHDRVRLGVQTVQRGHVLVGRDEVEVRIVRAARRGLVHGVVEDNAGRLLRLHLLLPRSVDVRHVIVEHARFGADRGHFADRSLRVRPVGGRGDPDTGE